MRTDAFGQSCSARGLRNLLLDHGLVQVKREGGPHCGSRQIRAAGKTNCQAQSVDALGYLRSSANGRTARPSPRARSRSCWRFTPSKWACSRSLTAEGGTGALAQGIALSGSQMTSQRLFDLC